ncbi:MAG: RNA polymerase sigma factor [Chloroflexota bacterium]|nr:RNA polymerase sigma factor [Chloroflexota bacterium]
MASGVFPGKMSEEEALPALLAEDLEAHFERLVRVFQDRLYGFALRLTRSPQDAEETTQDAFVRAFRALERNSVEQRAALLLKPWLYRITLNVVRNRARRPSLSLVPVDGQLGDELAADWADEPQAISETAERRRELARLLADLPPRYGTAVILRHVQGLSYAEAAEVLGQPVGTTKSDVHRGLRLLREALERRPLLVGR